MKEKYLKDYKPSEFLIDKTELHIALHETATRVRSTLHVRRNPDAQAAADLVLDGEKLKLSSVKIDGKAVAAEAYQETGGQLILHSVPQTFVLEIENETDPKANTALNGLYLSNGMYCTQCEAEGFRRITYYLDRPDVMSKFTTTVEGDKKQTPILLSNGNPIARGETGDRHWVTWEDPFAKPSYLFALVGGDLAKVTDNFTTQSGREVAIEFYVDDAHKNFCGHAIESLKKSMAWDEQQYGREYDLDIYMVVAVSDFNMGAMENKGLNIFNTKYVLADARLATDADFQGVEAVIGHEYFHNWTGNRITCRDWFQLSLKEGLTVFREQQFSAYCGQGEAKRLQEVRIMRTEQFPQDAGPMAHPIRPDSYIEMNNFYTVTVYNKGAEVIRMLHTLLGADGFRRGMDNYFDKHDGQAVTTEDFVNALEEVNDIDLSAFRLWYAQAGTPKLTVTDSYDAAAKTYTLHVEQHIPDTPGQTDKVPMLMPLRMGLLSQDGKALSLGESEECVLPVRAAKESFVFENIPEAPIPSLLRGFSAPVELAYDYSDTALLQLLQYDSDAFVRYEAVQTLYRRAQATLLADWQQGRPLTMPELVKAVIETLLRDKETDGALLAEMLRMPNDREMALGQDQVDVEGNYTVYQFLQTAIASDLAGELINRYHHLRTGKYSLLPQAMAIRSLRNQIMKMAVRTGAHDVVDALIERYRDSDNMTDTLGVLDAIKDCNLQVKTRIFSEFYNQWEGEALLIDKWFALQATSSLPGTFERVKELVRHPQFSLQNPNRARALLASFAKLNHYHFHRDDGAGYELMAQMILQLDKLNPQTAARLVEPFLRWTHYDDKRRQLMHVQLQHLANQKGLSRDVFEIVSKALV